MPDGLRPLAIEAGEIGIFDVDSLITAWIAGTVRFDGPGEALLVAVDDVAGTLIGVGGLTACPHLDGALRVRCFYVATARRRQGIATALASALLSSAFDHADTITCNALASATAAPFWEALGFEPTNAAGFTHVPRRRDTGPSLRADSGRSA